MKIFTIIVLLYRTSHNLSKSAYNMCKNYFHLIISHIILYKSIYSLTVRNIIRDRVGITIFNHFSGKWCIFFQDNKGIQRELLLQESVRLEWT